MSARPVSPLPDGGAEDYDRLAPALWNPVGNAVVAAADVLVGERVLDVFAATGTATVPAAQLTGPDGRVDAVDRSPAMLDLAEAKAEALGLDGVSFQRVYPARWAPEAPYDAVVSCYGILLLDDLDADMDRIVRMLRRGGRVALSTWDDGALEPIGDLLLEVLGPDGAGRSGTAFLENCRKLASADCLRNWLHARGLTNVRVEQFGLAVPLDPDSAWSLVLGTGYRGLLPEDPAALEKVRAAFLDRLGDDVVLTADTLIAVGDYLPAQ
ncbi:class I SAM-dependent methyltransferase [Arthrobacter sp. Ld5]|uniref:class I SAM-dependent methyltransferase n=1 Tax=Arthrobacter sp. Ld5 TaxID=649152 RepID=UPI003EB6A59E